VWLVHITWSMLEPLLPHRARPTHRGERVALRHCESLGWEVLAANLRLSHDEADLLCLDESRHPVLVEVKSGAAGGLDPLLHLDGGKRRRLRRLALRLARSPILGEGRGAVPRIDVIIVTLGETPSDDRVRDHFRQAVESSDRRSGQASGGASGQRPFRLWLPPANARRSRRSGLEDDQRK
jgi:Holliday junction resolvase-like predicted endonuclease